LTNNSIFRVGPTPVGKKGGDIENAVGSAKKFLEQSAIGRTPDGAKAGLSFST
jgi:hypothetical protein